MRYPVSGANSSAIEPSTGANRSLLGRDIPTGRTFWLRGVWYGSSGTQGAFLLYDCTAGSTAFTSSTLRASLPAVLAATGGYVAGMIEFPPPGLEFKTGCCAALAASGAIAIGNAGGCGFEAG